MPRGPAGTSPCQRVYYCPDCHARLDLRTKLGTVSSHLCGESFCRNCRVFHVEEDYHRCHMRSTPSRTSRSKRFLFYDFECAVDERGDHVPVLVVSRTACDACQDPSGEVPCASCGSRCPRCDRRNERGEYVVAPCPQTCGRRQVVHRGRGAGTEFCRWLFSPQHRGFTCLAHNARSYDAYFLYAYLVSNGLAPEVVFRGAKLMYCKVSGGLGIRLLDSLSFMPMPLADLPKSFGLGEESCKGFFPHLHSVTSTLEDPSLQRLPRLPDPAAYDPESMRPERREEFLRWYEAHRSDPFDYWGDMERYCASDVDVLTRACWTFRQMLLDIAGVDPYDYLTIASVCMGVFRTRFLPETWTVISRRDAVPGCHHERNCRCSRTAGRKTDGDAPTEKLTDERGWVPVEPGDHATFVSSPLALLPARGYSLDPHSLAALQWIEVFRRDYASRHGCEVPEVRTALSPEGEARLRCGNRTYRVDGHFVDARGISHVLEFHGCPYHGCPRCYPRDRDAHCVGGKSMMGRYRDTIMRSEALRGAGHLVHEMWSCDFTRRLAADAEARRVTEEEEHVPRDPMDVRDAYYGGRTNALTLYKRFVGPHERGGCADFCSLYPYTLKYGTYPAGHPRHVTGRFERPVPGPCPDPASCPCEGRHHLSYPYFGFAKVTVLPPRGLLHPVLPVRIRGKLMFPLCRTCAERNAGPDPCRCTPRERAWTATYCTPELETALNVGYRQVRVHEVLHWDETVTGSLFAPYVDTFLRIKAEASGLPHGENAESYAASYARREGVVLDPGRIARNPGLRSLAKLALNSFYGKFGQRTNMKKCTLVTTAEDLHLLLTDFTKRVSDFHVLGERVMAVEYTRQAEFLTTDPKTNVTVSAFCSAWARLKLWGAMRALGGRVVYHDTDSLLYAYTPRDPPPTHGSFLGDLTDELACDKVGCRGCAEGHWIVEFVSCGPKNYAYRLNTGQVTCRVRGFSLDLAASRVVNFESMRGALEAWRAGEDPPEMVTVRTHILRNRITRRVYSRRVAKHYGVVYDKRAVLPDYSTLPFGFA